MWGCVCSRRSLDRTHWHIAGSVRIKIGDQKRLFQRWFQTALVVSARMWKSMFQLSAFSGDDPNEHLWPNLETIHVSEEWFQANFETQIQKEFVGVEDTEGFFSLFQRPCACLQMPRAPVSHDPGWRLTSRETLLADTQTETTFNPLGNTNTIIITYTLIHALHICICIYRHTYIYIYIYMCIYNTL